MELVLLYLVKVFGGGWEMFCSIYVGSLELNSCSVLYLHDQNKLNSSPNSFQFFCYRLPALPFTYETHMCTHQIFWSSPLGRSSPVVDPLQKSPPVEPLASLVSSGSSTAPVSHRSPIATSRVKAAATQKTMDVTEQRRGKFFQCCKVFYKAYKLA